MATAERALTMRASDLLNRQEKKLTITMPDNLHAQIKSIAAMSRMSVKDLMIEALLNYTIPQYTGKEVVDE